MVRKLHMLQSQSQMLSYLQGTLFQELRYALCGPGKVPLCLEERCRVIYHVLSLMATSCAPHGGFGGVAAYQDNWPVAYKFVKKGVENMA